MKRREFIMVSLNVAGAGVLCEGGHSCAADASRHGRRAPPDCGRNRIGTLVVDAL